MTNAAVRTRQELIDHLFLLMDDFDGAGNNWENQDIYTFLQAMAAWLNDCAGYYQNKRQQVDIDQATWQLFADALSAAAVYE